MHFIKLDHNNSLPDIFSKTVITVITYILMLSEQISVLSLQ